MNMLDYTQSFEQFATSLKPMDLALYAGAAIVLFVLFKDKLKPLQSVAIKLSDTLNLRNIWTKENTTSVSSPKEDIFFQLVSSWKQTRDLAVKSGCDEAVKVADQMFPYLSPHGCNDTIKEQTL